VLTQCGDQLRDLRVALGNTIEVGLQREAAAPPFDVNQAGDGSNAVAPDRGKGLDLI
jgi:hypothetical protein